MSSERTQKHLEHCEGDKGDSLSGVLCDQLVRRLNGLASPEMKRCSVDRFYQDQSASDAARAFNDVLVLSVLGHSMARDAWLPIAKWLIANVRSRALEISTEIGRVAEEQGDDPIAAILRFGPARKALPEVARNRVEAVLNADSVVFPSSEARSNMLYLDRFLLAGPVMFSEVTTAEQKEDEFCWVLTKGELSRWIKGDVVVEGITTITWDSAFARKLLGEDWLELKHLLVIIAKRPLNDAMAFEVVLNDRWGGHLKIHEALANNPFTPSEIVMPLLPLLSQKTLKRLAAPGEAPSCVYNAASALLRCAQP